MDDIKYSGVWRTADDIALGWIREYIDKHKEQIEERVKQYATENYVRTFEESEFLGDQFAEH